MTSALELLLFFRCPACGAGAGEYLGDELHHVFGITHDAGCPQGPSDEAAEYFYDDTGEVA